MKFSSPFRALGAEKIGTAGIITIAVIAFFVVGFVVARLQFAGLALFFILPLAAAYLVSVFTSRRFGFISLVLWAFLGIGMGRYATSFLGGSVLGLGIDVILFLILLSALFSGMVEKKELSFLKSPTVIFTFVWFGINILQMFNPMSPGFEAWFYAGRGVAFNMLFCIPLAILLFNKQKDLSSFLNLWIILSVIGTLWGLKQKFIGLDGAETQWLNDGNFSTHMLHGNLRIFSFFTDAGQFGASQGHAAVAALILSLGPSSARRKIFYTAAGLLCLYGMIISGTRGALAVPLIGSFVYLILSKNWKILSIGLIVLAIAYGFLKFTYIGQDNYDIRRLRTALDPNDASLQVRLLNQAKLAEYLNSHPFGGGVGAGGYWGTRFKPGSFLAELALDSWYVRIASDYGWVGLAYYVVMILYFIFSGFFVVFRMTDALFRQQLAALYAGMVGIAVASYGNQVWGQMPTGIIIYLSLAFLSVVPQKYPQFYAVSSNALSPDSSKK
jgi:hypothetical protein